MRTIAIYPGRFHPFHRGHLSTYQHLVREYGVENVFVVTSNTQSPLTSPFSFEDKKEMMVTLGVPDDKCVQVKNPYSSQEVTSRFDPEDTIVVYAVSEKDAGRFSFAPKKDGSPSYLQPLGVDELQPLSKHAYITVAPTVGFKVEGISVTSATRIRQMYMGGDDQTRSQIIIDLYGKHYPKLQRIFDKKLGITEQIVRFMDTYRPLVMESKTAASRIEKILGLERAAHAEFNP